MAAWGERERDTELCDGEILLCCETLHERRPIPALLFLLVTTLCLSYILLAFLPPVNPIVQFATMWMATGRSLIKERENVDENVY